MSTILYVLKVLPIGYYELPCEYQANCYGNAFSNKQKSIVTSFVSFAYNFFAEHIGRFLR